jgi:hypothetical protein
MRSDLRLDDLRRHARGTNKLMNVKIPVAVSDAIDGLAAALRVAKTDVVIALLNEGLDRSRDLLRGWRPKAVAPPPPERVCKRSGCGRPRVARGLCASHYQARRRRRGG